MSVDKISKHPLPEAAQTGIGRALLVGHATDLVQCLSRGRCSWRKVGEYDLNRKGRTWVAISWLPNTRQIVARYLINNVAKRHSYGGGDIAMRSDRARFVPQPEISAFASVSASGQRRAAGASTVHYGLW
jgi:hypothetical protein